MRSEDNNKRKSAVYDRYRRRNIAFGTFAVIILAVMSLFTPVFNVGKITVVGNKILSEEAVIRASGIEKGDNFIFINTKNREKAVNSLGYVDSVSVKRKFFTNIEIEIKEAKEIAYVAFSGNYVGIDKNGKVLSITKSSKLTPKKAVISGLGIKSVKKGQIIRAKDNEKFGITTKLLGILEKNELLSDTKKINVTDVSNLSFTLNSGTRILLGDATELDYKMEYAMVVLEKQSNAVGGTVDISDTSNVIYRPDEGGEKK